MEHSKNASRAEEGYQKPPPSRQSGIGKSPGSAWEAAETAWGQGHAWDTRGMTSHDSSDDSMFAEVCADVLSERHSHALNELLMGDRGGFPDASFPGHDFRDAAFRNHELRDTTA